MKKLVLTHFFCWILIIGANLFALPSHAANQRHIKIISDLEGKIELLETAFDDSLNLVNGRLEFLNESTELLFLGDVADLGPHSIALVHLLLDLKKRYPNRVHLIGGNHDYNKLQILNEVPAVGSLKVPAYRDWLKSTFASEAGRFSNDDAFIKYFNTLTNQLQYVLQHKELGKVLEFHRQELSAKSGREISLEVAAADYYKWISPGGEFWEFLEHLQLGFSRDELFAVHGGVTKHGVGYVPDRTERNYDVDAWIADLNRWGHDELSAYKAALSTRENTNTVRSHLISYGDAVYDSVANIVISKSRTVIYSHKSKTDGNYRLYDQEVIDVLKRSGKKLAIQGHSPVGNIALTLSDGQGFHLLMADTSRSKNNSSKIEIKGDEVIGLGHMSDGGKVQLHFTIGSTGKIGMKSGDKIVIGETEDGRAVTYRYEGRRIVEIPVSEVKATDLQVPWAEPDKSATKRMEELKQVLIGRGIPVLDASELNSGYYANRTPIFLTGSVKFAYDPSMDAIVGKFAEDFFKSLDPTKVFVVTGATNKGLESHLSRLSQTNRIHNLGTVAFQSRAENIAAADAIHLTGETRVERMENTLRFIRERNGVAVFIAGGEIISSGIKQAQRENIQHFLMSTVEGAAKDAATGATGFASAQELVAKLKVSRPAFIKRQAGTSHLSRRRSCSDSFERKATGLADEY